MDIKELKEKLTYNPKHVQTYIEVDEVKKADEFSEGYKAFLNVAKTEREAVVEAIKQAETAGFVPFEQDKKYVAGDRVYLNNRGKSVIFAVIGKKGCTEGVRIAAAHVDSPRLDLKPNPMYEDSEIAYLKTHYYGGIRKYQWPVIPLAMHGVIVKNDGTIVNICIGEKEGEPKFVISDLLPHLAAKQSERKLYDGIRGEELNVIIGSRPLDNSDESQLVKLNILNILFETYGITESDFLSAEIEMVPAYKADDVGFDRSLIGSYGHDDRVCAYPALKAILNIDIPEKTVLSILTDKEEVGSDGNTGLNSAYLKYFICDLAKAEGLDAWRVMSMSECLSADVNAAYDPTFCDVFDKLNASYLNKGVVITKYTGARGKSSTSDASAEFMGRVRSLLDKNNIVWQIGELGKVDEGGGGTVAKYIANLNIDVVDLGVPVLSMHSPYELISKLDIYMAYRAFYAFFAD
ncbi:MAG TPA: aminopeptidase [Clostridiales bacterium]|nr:aminopeptidase [Clostridiales bacterium]